MGLRLNLLLSRRQREANSAATVKMVDEATILKICDIYDWDGKGELDMFFLGDVIYACGLNTTKKVCVGLGMTDEEGKKFAKFADIVAKVQEAKAAPNSSGCYKDYMDLCKLEDILANLGDEIPKDDVLKLFAEIADPEDEDGFFPYVPFMDKLTGK